MFADEPRCRPPGGQPMIRRLLAAALAIPLELDLYHDDEPLRSSA